MKKIIILAMAMAFLSCFSADCLAQRTSSGIPPHKLFSPFHLDATTLPTVTGQVPIWNNTTKKWEPGMGATTTFVSLTDVPSSYTGQGSKFVKVNAGETALEFTASTSAPHSILDSTQHTDTLTGTVLRGDILVGNLTPKWARVAKGTSGSVLTSGASDVAWTTWYLSGIAAQTYTLPPATAYLTGGNVTLSGPTSTRRTITVSDNDFTLTVASGKALTLAGSLTTTGAYDVSFTMPGAYTYTFPSSTSYLAILGANTFTADQTISTHNIVTDTSTGSKIGTATNQKLGFFNSTPVVQQTGDVVTGLNALGLVVSGTVALATAATNTTITDDTTTNATMYPTWVTTTTGNLPQKVSSTKLYFNPSTGILTATGFAGALTGNVTGNVSGTAATVTGAAQASITSVGTLTGLSVSGPVVPNSAGATTVGSLALPFSSFYVGAAGTNNIQITGTATGSKVATFPDVNGTVAVAATSTTATQALFATATAGAPAYRAIADADLPATIKALTLTAAADGFTVTGGTTPRTLTVQTGAVTLTANSAGSTLVLPSGSTTLGAMSTAAGSWASPGAALGTGTAVAGTFTTLAATNTGSLTLGVAGGAVGQVLFKNATSGTLTVEPITGALGTPTLVLGTTFTDNKWCSYATATGFTCNQSAPTGGGTITAVGDIVTAEAFTTGTPGKTLTFNNATSGTIVLQAVTGALGTTVLSLPATTGTIAKTSDVSTAVSNHAALITGVHGLVFTAGKTLTLATSLSVGTGDVTLTGNVAGSTLVLPAGSNTLGTAAFTATTAYEPAGGSSAITTVGTITSGIWSGTTIAVAKGGTNSGTALNNNRVMQSSAGAIIEATAITASRALVSDTNGIPVHSTTSTTQLQYLAGATGTTGTTTQKIVFDTSPTLVTPTLGVATATSINKVAITAPATASTLTIADGSSLITAGAYAITLTSTATTGVTLPTSGTLYGTKSASITSAQLYGSLSDETGSGSGSPLAVFNVNPTLSGATFTDATDIAFNTTTGTKIGTSTSQKLAFYNSTPIVKPTGSVITALTNLGLVASPTIDVSTLTVGNWKVLYSNSAGVLIELPLGTNGQFLQSTGATSAPVFATATGTGDLKADGTVPLTANWNAAATKSDVVITAGSFATIKVDGVAGQSCVYTASGVQTYGTCWEGKDASMSANLLLKFPDADPTADQVMAFSAPSSNRSTISWVLPVKQTTGTQTSFDNTVASGGVLYGSGAGIVKSTAALTQYGVLYGGGAGNPPVSTSIGTTGQVFAGTTGGAPLFTNLATLNTPTRGGTGVAQASDLSTITISGAYPLTLTLGVDTRLNLSNFVSATSTYIKPSATTIVPLGAGTIQAAIAAATAGDTLILSSGTYTITAAINVDRWLNIVGQGNAGLMSTTETDVHGTLIYCATDGVTMFNITSSNVRLAHMSILHAGATASKIVATAENLDGLVFTNVDAIMSTTAGAATAGAKTAFDILGSTALFRDVVMRVRSTNSTAYGIYAHNTSSTSAARIVDVHTSYAYTDGGLTRSTPFWVYNNNNVLTMTMNLYNSTAVTTEATANDDAAAATSTTSNAAVLNVYSSTLDGKDTDLYRDGTNAVTVYGGILVNNAYTSGITFGGTIAANLFTGTITAANTVTVADDYATAATMYPAWFTANTGNLPPKVSSTKLSFRPDTGILTATGFAGAHNGTVGATTPAAGTFTTLTANAASSLTLGTASTNTGAAIFKSAGSAFDFTIQAGTTTPGSIGWTLPVAAPAGNSYLLTASTAGVLSYTNPDTFSVKAGSSSIITVGALTQGSLATGFTAVTVPLGGTGLSVGTEGGIPWFTTTTAMASSALLTQYGVMIGGGVDAAPSTITASTTTTHALFATAGAPAFRALAVTDLPIVTGTYGGTGVNNGSSTITIGGNVVFSGAYAMQFTVPGAYTYTLPSATSALARSDAAQTFTGIQAFTSPAITTSIDTASTSFTAFAGATTLLTIGGTGASASLFAPSTLDATTSTTGAIRTSGGISAAKAGVIGTTLSVLGASSLTLGTASSATGSVIFGGAGSAFKFTIQAGTTTPGSISWTLPVAAPAGNGYFVTASTAGALSYTDPTTLCTPTEIDGHLAASPTAAQLRACNATTIHNNGQGANSVNITLPATAANLSFLATVAETQAANYWRFTSTAGADMYLDGSATGKNYVQFATPAAGGYFSCFTMNIGGTYKWICSSGIGALTTN